MDERAKASELVGIITATKAQNKTHEEVTGPVWGDGHSFGSNEHDRETIIDEEIDVPENSFLRMRRARKELIRIHQNTYDEEVKAMCEEGINHEHVKFGLPEYAASAVMLTIGSGILYGLYWTATN